MVIKKMTISKAQKKQIGLIVKIHKDCIHKTNAKFYDAKIIKEWFKQISQKNVLEQFQNTSWYVIKFSNKIIGFCQFSLKEKILYQINISPHFQSKGAGEILYNFIEKKFIKNKKEKILLNSTLNAEKFYKKLGFKKIKSIKFKLNEQSIKMIKMAKNLSD